MTRHLYLDTEFTNLEAPDQISLALVPDAGAPFYVELTDFSRGACSPFVVEVVLPLLGRYPDRIMPRALASEELHGWLHSVKADHEWVEVRYDYLGDWQLMRELLGSVPSWITYRKIRALDINRLAYEAAIAESGLPAHHALADAMALKKGARRLGPDEDGA